MARLEFELTHYDSAAQRFNHYTTRIPPPHDFDDFSERNSSTLLRRWAVQQSAIFCISHWLGLLLLLLLLLLSYSITPAFAGDFSLGSELPPQVSRTLPSIWADINNAVGWITSNFFLISSSSSVWESLQTHQLQLVSPLPLCSTFCFRSRSKYLFIFLLSFFFHFVVRRNDKIH